MSVSAIFGARLVLPPPSSAATKAVPLQTLGGGGHGGSGLLIECSSRPQKKATKHHMKTRPRKTSPSDIRRRPTVYPPLPPLPPDWTLVSEDTSADAPAPTTATATAPAPPEAVQSE